MAGKGGGAWKVAYADFVTAMMAFFLVMWIVGQNKPVKQAIAGYFRDPLGFQSANGGSGLLPGQTSGPPIINLRLSNGSKDPGGPANAHPEGATSEHPEATPAAKPFMLVLHDGENDSVGTLIAFAEDSAELDDLGQRTLTELAIRVRGKRNKIEIRGHASLRPLPEDSPYQDAWQLSYARCLATMTHLIRKGVEPERIRLSQAGGYEPHTHKVEHGAQSQNSRVEVFLLGEFVEDLQGTRKERTQRVENPGSHDGPAAEPGHAKAEH